MKAERKDSSVLFQIDHLRASSGQARARAGEPPKPSSPRSAKNQDESSGLLDMHKLAQAYAADRKQPDNSDAIPSLIATNTTPAGMLAPVLLPMPVRSARQKLLIALTGLSGVIAAFVLITAIVLAHRQDQEKAQATMAALEARSADSEATAMPQPAPSSGQTAAAETRVPELTVPAPAAAIAADEVMANAPESQEARPGEEARPGNTPGNTNEEEQAQVRERADASERRARDEREGREGDDERAEREERRARERRSSANLLDIGGSSSEPAGRDSGGKCMDEVACLLADGDAPACCERYQSRRRSGNAEEERPGNVRLPDALSRGDITAAMNGVRSAVAKCGQRYVGGGTVTLSVRVTSSGDVAAADVKSSPSEALGMCVAGAVKSAKFPESKKGVKFSYPFILR